MAGYELIIGAAAVVTATAPLLPWYVATRRSPSLPGLIVDEMASPRGTATGLYAHPFLKVVMVLAALQLALLLARYYYPGGRLRVPMYGWLLTAGSALICLIVGAGILLIPGPWADILSINGTWSIPFPWAGVPVPLVDGTTLVMTWRYGAAVALTVALASLACALLLTNTLELAREQSRRDDQEPA